jgi:hypothetical protein
MSVDRLVESYAKGESVYDSVTSLRSLLQRRCQRQPVDKEGIAKPILDALKQLHAAAAVRGPAGDAQLLEAFQALTGVWCDVVLPLHISGLAAAPATAGVALDDAVLALTRAVNGEITTDLVDGFVIDLCERIIHRLEAAAPLVPREATLLHHVQRDAADMSDAAVLSRAASAVAANGTGRALVSLHATAASLVAVHQAMEATPTALPKAAAAPAISSDYWPRGFFHALQSRSVAALLCEAADATADKEAMQKAIESADAIALSLGGGSNAASGATAAGLFLAAVASLMTHSGAKPSVARGRALNQLNVVFFVRAGAPLAGNSALRAQFAHFRRLES